MDTAPDFEQGPIRPPSEAGSLLIRVTRNCPWNKCAFCGTYKGKTFSRRSIDEIKADIDASRDIVDQISEMSRKIGGAGQLTRELLTDILHNGSLPDAFRSVALWLASGGNTVFLQDANSIILSTDSLVSILDYIKKTFPKVDRVTSYARSVTLKGKSAEDFRRLKQAGLSRLHVGMESGSDRILKMISKGARAHQVIEGCKRVVESGISLSLYVIPGIGGTDLSDENAVESAKVINAINPSFVRFRSLFVRRKSELQDLMDQGKFIPPSEDQMVREIRLLIENLDGISTRIVSDHILNLLEDVEGVLPEDKDAILGIIDSYLSMSDEDRLLFQLGRRGGAIRSMDDFKNDLLRQRLKSAKKQIDKEFPGGIPEYLQIMKRQFV